MPRIIPTGTATQHLLVWQSKSLWLTLISTSSLKFLLKLHLILNHSWKGACVCGQGHNSCAGLLRGKAGLAGLEHWSLCPRLLKEMKLALISFFLLSCQALVPAIRVFNLHRPQKKRKASEHAVQNPPMSLQQSSPLLVVHEAFHCGA